MYDFNPYMANMMQGGQMPLGITPMMQRPANLGGPQLMAVPGLHNFQPPQMLSPGAMPQRPNPLAGMNPAAMSGLKDFGKWLTAPANANEQAVNSTLDKTGSSDPFAQGAAQSSDLRGQSSFLGFLRSLF